MTVPTRNEQKNKNAERILKQAGYSCKIGSYAKGGAVHSDEKEDKALIKKMVKKKDLKPEKKAEGGFVHGGMPAKRLDKISRQTDKGGDKNTTQPFTTGKEKFAKGGKVKGKGKTQVNVIIGHGGQPTPPMGPPPMAAPPPPPAAMPPRPMVPPPGAMPPPGAGVAPAGMPMRAKGGKVPKMEFGAGGGKGRLEKKALYGKPAKN
jgi:hypothetical protein